MVGRKPKSQDPYAEITKRLDMLIAVLLTQNGLKRKEVAKILRVDEKTIHRMFQGKWSRIQRSMNEQ